MKPSNASDYCNKEARPTDTRRNR